jgi:hypothetical protein
VGLAPLDVVRVRCPTRQTATQNDALDPGVARSLMGMRTNGTSSAELDDTSPSGEGVLTLVGRRSNTHSEPAYADVDGHEQQTCATTRRA